MVHLECPWCGARKGSKVTQTRGRNGHRLYRRRQCHACSTRFSTYEAISPKERVVYDAKGRQTPFSLDRVDDDIRIACAKLPISRGDIDLSIDLALASLRRPRLSTAEIRQVIAEALDNLHPVAAVRYAALDCRDAADLMMILVDRYRDNAKVASA